VTPSSTISTLPTQGVACGYSYREWSQLSAAQKRGIYHERDRTNTARTVASIMQEQQEQGSISQANASDNTQTTSPYLHAGQV
jgi:hypothetical protein